MGDGHFPTVPIDQTRRCRRCRLNKPMTEFGENYSYSHRFGASYGHCLQCETVTRRRPAMKVANQYTAEPLPPRRGSRVLIEGRDYIHVDPSGDRVRKVLVRCACGDETYVMARDWRSGRSGQQCRTCSGKLNGLKGGRKVGQPPANTKRTEHRVRFDSIPWDQDDEVQEFVRQHPHGASLEEIGQYLQLTRERVRQLETVALRCMRFRLEQGGLSAADIREGLEQLCRTKHRAATYEFPTFDGGGS